MRNSAFVLLMVLAFASSSQAQSVSVFTDDFSGSHVDLNIGKYPYTTLLRQGVTRVYAFKIPAGLRVTYFLEKEFTGKSIVLTSDISAKDLKARGFSETVFAFSLIIDRAPAPAQSNGSAVTIYADNFSGASQVLTPGKYEFTDLSIGNDMLTSIKIPKGLKVTLYEHEAFGGRSVSFTNDVGADLMLKSKFNDLTSSLIVEALPEEVKPSEPVVVAPVVVPTVVNEPKAVIAAVTIYQGDFTGDHKELVVGEWALDGLVIGDNELSSIRIPKGMRVKLFDSNNFEGRFLVLTEDASSAFLNSNQFNNVTSSLIVEMVPMVTIYQGDFAGTAQILEVGRYRLAKLSIGAAELSSVRIPPGFKVTLFEKDGFTGKSLALTHDTGTSDLVASKFNNLASSIVVEKVEAAAPVAVPMVTLFTDDFKGNSARLGPGKYDFRDAGFEDNALTTIRVPRGLRVTLFELGSFKGRSLTLQADGSFETFSSREFDDITTSMIVEEIPSAEITVTIYRDTFMGRSQILGPGRYTTSDLTIGNDQLTSVRVPKGMRAILYENDYFAGRSVTLEESKDLENVFSDQTSSLVIEDIFEPISGPQVAVPVVVPAPVTPTQPEPTIPIVEAPQGPPPCMMTDKQYENAVKAVKSNSFRDELMTTAKLATKDKCLNLDQIRGIAKLFSFEDQSLEFVLYAYDLSTEQSEYYTLEDLFKFMSSKDEFTKFLQRK